VSGRRVKRRCVAPRRSNRGNARCQRTVTVSAKTRRIAAGSTTIKLPTLTSGRYRVTLMATDAAGNAKTVRSSLVVNKRKRTSVD
jgi:hypothetical protein